MKNLIWVLVAVLSVAFISQESFSQKRFHKKQNEFRGQFMTKLNLTEEQEKKFEQLRFAHQEKMVKLRSDVELKELELKKLTSGDNVTRSEMLKLTKELNEIKNEIAIARVNHKMDVYDNLDANQKKLWLEQKEKVGMMKDRMKEKFHQRRG
jgi:Spy/CpxP family protein refolding chaperone